MLVCSLQNRNECWRLFVSNFRLVRISFESHLTFDLIWLAATYQYFNFFAIISFFFFLFSTEIIPQKRKHTLWNSVTKMVLHSLLFLPEGCLVSQSMHGISHRLTRKEVRNNYYQWKYKLITTIFKCIIYVQPPITAREKMTAICGKQLCCN